jgi:ribosomal protein S18 acetylase RimI-like enzyme
MQPGGAAQLYIISLGVLAPFRGAGIGERLCSAAMQAVAAAAIAAVAAAATAAAAALPWSAQVCYCCELH